MVPANDEQPAPMVADPVAPARQPHGLVDVAVAERAAGVGPVTMHGCSKNRCRRARIGRPEACPKFRRVYPTRTGAATNAAGHFGFKRGRYRAHPTSTLCLSA